MSEKEYIRFSKLENFTYYWDTFLIYSDGDGDIEKNKITGKGFSLKIY